VSRSSRAVQAAVGVTLGSPAASDGHELWNCSMTASDGGSQHVATVIGGGTGSSHDLIGQDPRLQSCNNIPLSWPVNVCGRFDG
jgi:hypothetical protein